MDQCIYPLQGTGKVALDEIVDNHYLNVASVDLGETLFILRVFRGADSAGNNQQIRIEHRMAVRYSPPDTVTLSDQLINNVGPQEPGDTSNLQNTV